jgi:hypothetical protein
MHGRVPKCVQTLVGKPEEKGPFGKPKRRCEILLESKIIGWEGVDLINLAQEWMAGFL